jgi:hypothetical protein
MNDRKCIVTLIADCQVLGRAGWVRGFVGQGLSSPGGRFTMPPDRASPKGHADSQNDTADPMADRGDGTHRHRDVPWVEKNPACSFVPWLVPH